jgi:hypothetical protein
MQGTSEVDGVQPSDVSEGGKELLGDAMVEQYSIDAAEDQRMDQQENSSLGHADQQDDMDGNMGCGVWDEEYFSNNADEQTGRDANNTDEQTGRDANNTDEESGDSSVDTDEESDESEEDMVDVFLNN